MLKLSYLINCKNKKVVLTLLAEKSFMVENCNISSDTVTYNRFDLETLTRGQRVTSYI